MKNLLLMPFKAAFEVFKFLEQLLVGIVNTILQIFGMKPIPTPNRVNPLLEKSAGETVSEVDKILSSARVPSASDTKLLKPTTEAGLALHRYASASNGQRATMPLNELTDEQLIYLFKLSDHDLKRLATAGVDACTKAIAGKKCGIGDLPNFHEIQKENKEQEEKKKPKISLKKTTNFSCFA